MLNFASIDEAFPNDDKSKKKIKKLSSSNDDCKPLQSPNYSVAEFSCNDPKKMNEIINSSLSFNGNINNNPNNTNNPNNYLKDGVKSFDYDEFDAYLNVADIKTNNIDTSSEYRTTPFLVDYLKSLKQNINKPITQSTDKVLNIEQFSNLTSTNNMNITVDVNLYNLFLFVFLGIIVILLVHQITLLVKQVNI
jgi:hypothetical protein